MSEILPSFSGLKITSYYKYILYLSGVILILSIFLDTKAISNIYVRRNAFLIIVITLLIWFFDSIIAKASYYYELGYTDYSEKAGADLIDAKKSRSTFRKLNILRYMMHIGVWIWYINYTSIIPFLQKISY